MRWIIVAACVWAVLALAVSRMLYFPVRSTADGQPTPPGAEDVRIGSLHGYFLQKRNARLVTLHLHGNAGNITHRLPIAAQILEAGSAVLLLDYRGYGRSPGWPTERGLYADAEAAFDWLAGRGQTRIVLHGESLGTAVAVELATRRRIAGLVLEAPLPSARAVAHRVMPFIGPALVWGYDSLSKIGRVGAPLLVIHGDRDEVIPYDLGMRLYQAAAEPKSLWTIRGAMHNDLHEVGREEFVSRLRAFYEGL